jgi:hypothetical protein
MNKEQIAKIAGEAGAKAALEAWDKRWKEQRKIQYDTRLWNTRMLLRHYNSLKEYCEKAIYSRETMAAAEKPVEILESLGGCTKDEYIESIKGSTIRTITIMAHVDAMLKLYKIYCETSGRPEDARKYRILQAVYFDKVKIAEICETENIDRSTYYRDNRESSEMLSALIFGADGLSAMRQRGN